MVSANFLTTLALFVYFAAVALERLGLLGARDSNNRGNTWNVVVGGASAIVAVALLFQLV